MKTSLEDVILTYIDWSKDKTRDDVLKLATALIYHYYKNNKIYESLDCISNEAGYVELMVELKKPRPKLTLVKTEKTRD